MHEDALNALVLATIMACPESERPTQHPTGIQIVLERHDSSSFTFESSETSPQNHTAGFVYAFPPFFLKMDRENEKKLKKMNKKFFNRKGFTLEVFAGEGNVWDSALIYRLNGSEGVDEVKRIQREFKMLTIYAFQVIGDFI